MIVHLGGGGGADLSAATATTSRVLLGDTFFSNASDDIQTGTMPNRGAVTITPSASAQTIAEGYHNGSGSVPAVSFTASNVLAGTTIAGTAGTMVNYSTTLLTSTSYSDTGSAIRLNTPSTGYMYAGSTGIQISYANLRTLIGLSLSSQLVIGNTILGLAGNATAVVTGTFTGTTNTYVDIVNSRFSGRTLTGLFIFHNDGAVREGSSSTVYWLMSYLYWNSEGWADSDAAIVIASSTTATNYYGTNTGTTVAAPVLSGNAISVVLRTNQRFATSSYNYRYVAIFD